MQAALREMLLQLMDGSNQQSADASTRWVLKIDPTFKEHAYCSMNEIQGQWTQTLPPPERKSQGIQCTIQEDEGAASNWSQTDSDSDLYTRICKAKLIALVAAMKQFANPSMKAMLVADQILMTLMS